MNNYLVTQCSRVCGYDAAYQPPEVIRCPVCNSVLIAVPINLIDEWKEMMGLITQGIEL